MPPASLPRPVLAVAVLAAVAAATGCTSAASDGASASGAPSAHRPSGTGTLLAAAPAAPTGLSAQALSSTLIEIRWTDVATDETSYVVERSADGVHFALAGTLGANLVGARDPGVLPGATYWYRVAAANAAGASAWSNVASAATPGSASAPSSGNAWRTLGHDERHSGYNPDEAGRPPLTLAWSVTPNQGQSLRPVVAEGGRVFVTSTGWGSPVNPVVAYDEATGAQAWQYNFGDTFSVGQPAVSNGELYIGQCDGWQSTFLWSFEAATGTVRWRSPMDAQWETYWAPVVSSGAVYCNGGTYGGIYGFRTSDGSQIFFQDVAQYDEWSPAVANGALLTFVDGVLDARSPVDGRVVASAAPGWSWHGWSMQTAPVVSNGRALVISPPNLLAYDLATLAPAASANATFSGTPAIANGVVYAISGGTLQARAESSLALLWTFVGDGRLSYPPAVAGGHVYVASDDNVYAVDVATHAQAFHGTRGGWLSIARGKLYVARQDGVLDAYRMTP